MKKNCLVGVDTHKDTLACYCDGQFREFKTTHNGFKEALKWSNSNVWAIEGAYCFGQAFTSFLTNNACRVYDINPLLTKNWRSALKVSSPKNDYGDAKVISLFANIDNMEEVSLQTIKLKQKLSTRKSLVKQKTQITNFIKMLYYTRGEELPFKCLDTKKAVKYLKEHSDIIIQVQGQVLETVINSIKLIEENIKESIKKNIPKQVIKLTEIKGISYITACTIYTETKGRLTTKEKFANYCGIAPIDCSSGKTHRMRNNKCGNRILNSIFYSLSIAQKRYNPISTAYYEKKIKEGKTPRHARKCLARQLCNIVFRILKQNN